jgi:hypothetical protein
LAETPITGQEPATDEARFAAAIAGFGQLLQGSVYLGDWGWDQAIELALAKGRRPLRLPDRGGEPDAAGAKPAAVQIPALGLVGGLAGADMPPRQDPHRPPAHRLHQCP